MVYFPSMITVILPPIISVVVIRILILEAEQQMSDKKAAWGKVVLSDHLTFRRSFA